MGNSARLLKIVFVILILVTIGELGFYFYIKNKPESSSNNLTKINNPNPLIKSDTISKMADYLGKLKKNDSTSVYYLMEQRAFIGEIKIGGVGEQTGKWAGIFIVDKNKNKIGSLTVQIDGASQGKHLLYKMVKDAKTPIPVSEAKVGDPVVRITKFDFVSGQNILDEMIIGG